MKNRHGFTILEVVIVVCLLGVLTVLGAPAFTGVIKDAGRVQCNRNIEIMSSVYQGEKERNPDVTLKEIVDNEGGLYFAEKFTCSGHRYMVREQKDQFEIFCPNHGGVIVDDIARNMVSHYEDAINLFQDAGLVSNAQVQEFMQGKNSKHPFAPTEHQLELLEKYKSYGDSSNDGLRKYLFIFHYDGKWPTLMGPKGETLYVQPYYGKSWSDNPNKEDIIVYANGVKDLEKNNWNTSFIFNKDDGQWYEKLPKTEFGIVGKTWAQVEGVITDPTKFKVYEGQAEF